MRWALCLPLVAAALALPSGDARADLPAGWIAGGPAATMPDATPPGSRSRAALQLAESPPRRELAPTVLSLADLSTVDVEPAPTSAQIDASNAAPPGEAPADLFVAPGCARASVSGHAVGIIQVGWVSLPIASQSGGGVSLWHVRGGDGRHLYVRAEWETLDRLPDGTLRYTETVARFNVVTCKARVARRYTAIARPFFGGLAFLFRTRCAACAPEERDVVHAITPGGGWGNEAFDHRRVALIPGAGQGFLERVSVARARRFGEVAGRAVAEPSAGMQAVIGIEAAQTLGERAPTVIAYAAEAPERGFGF